MSIGFCPAGFSMPLQTTSSNSQALSPPRRQRKGLKATNPLVDRQQLLNSVNKEGSNAAASQNNPSRTHACCQATPASISCLCTVVRIGMQVQTVAGPPARCVLNRFPGSKRVSARQTLNAAHNRVALRREVRAQRRPPVGRFDCNTAGLLILGPAVVP